MEWRKHFRGKKGILNFSYGALAFIVGNFWNIERYISLVDMPENLSRWQQIFMETKKMIPEWTNDLAPYVVGASLMYLSFFAFVKAEEVWTKIKAGRTWSSIRALWSGEGDWFIRYGLRRFKRAAQEVGWVTVRYGVGYDEKGHKREERSMSCRVWKGKGRQFVFPEPHFRGSFCFIEFPDVYKAAILSPNKAWDEKPSATPGYRRYESEAPIGLPYKTSVNSQVALVTVGIDEQGTGGCGAAWMDIKRGLESIIRGRVTF